MFKDITSKIKFLPAVNADSIKFFVSILIAWRVKYTAMWDNDSEGKKEYNKAVDFFGEQEGKNFLLLPSENRRKNSFILQSLFSGVDVKMIRHELEIPTNTAFEKTILMLYFSDKRKNIVNKISSETKKAVVYVFKKIKEAHGNFIPSN